jgi:mannose-6-phosphate isomerase-like protein (cupin superfamily)
MLQSNPKPPMPSTAIDWSAATERPNANGASRKFFEGPTPTLDLLECHATTLKPGAMNHEILERTHDEVIIIKEGTVEAYVKDKWVKLGPGGVLFNAANAPQAMRNSSDAPATYFVVMARPPAAAQAAK